MIVVTQVGILRRYFGLASAFFFPRTPMSRIYSKGNTWNFGRIRSEVWRKWLSAYKSSNISVQYALSIGVKINDLGWPWCVIMHSVSNHVRRRVVTYLYSFTFSLLLSSRWLQRMFNLMLAITALIFPKSEPQANNNWTIGCRQIHAASRFVVLRVNIFLYCITKFADNKPIYLQLQEEYNNNI